MVIASRHPRKQRERRFNAPLHIKHKFAGAHLSKELRKKHNTRALPVRKGDKVKIARGQFKGKQGAVDEVITKSEKVIVSGIDVEKKDGSKTKFAIHPSNLIIIELNLDDKVRKSIIERKKGNQHGKGSSQKI